MKLTLNSKTFPATGELSQLASHLAAVPLVAGCLKEKSMKVSTKIPDERIKDLLCSAFEGGSNYWIERADVPEKSKRPAQAKYWHECPAYGCEVAIHVSEDEPIKGQGKVYKLNRHNLESGLQVMSDKYPQHFADFVQENDDAVTGDVFLQCCLFGEAIFG